jgi:hypothetical protein
MQAAKKPSNRRAQILKRREANAPANDGDKSGSSKLTVGKLLERAAYTGAPDQKFAVFAYVGKTARQACDKFGINILGCFATMEAAKEFCLQLRTDWPYFDTWIMEMGAWDHIPVPEDKLGRMELNYDNTELQKIMDGHRTRLLASEKAMKGRLDKFRRTHKVHSETGTSISTVSPVAATAKPLPAEAKAAAEERGHTLPVGQAAAPQDTIVEPPTPELEEEAVETPASLEDDVNRRIAALKNLRASTVKEE